VPEATVRGVEVDGEIRPTRWLNLGANFAYTDAYFNKDTTDIFGTTTNFGPYADAPKWSGSFRAETHFDLPNNIGQFTTEGDVYSQAHSYFGSLNDTTVPGTEVSAYTIVNFRVALNDIAKTHVSVSAYVRNAFDRVYYIGGVPSSNLFGSNIQIPGVPRTYYGEVNYKF
jgi:iron complex outermembrane receptor protein